MDDSGAADAAAYGRRLSIAQSGYEDPEQPLAELAKQSVRTLRWMLVHKGTPWPGQAWPRGIPDPRVDDGRGQVGVN